MGDITRIDLLRHGNIVSKNLLCARRNEPLSKQGLKAMWDATENGHWDVIISSPAQRCLSFAEALADKTNTPLMIKEGFGELDFGDWMGENLTHLMTKHPKEFHPLWQNPEEFSAPGGESMIDFIERIKTNWNKLLADYSGQSILVITHAGVIRAILGHTLQINALSTLRFTIDYARLSRLHYYPDGIYSLTSLNRRKA